MKWKQKWRNTLQHWCFRYLPGIVNMAVAASTIPARKQVKGQRLQILLDNSVLGHSVTHETSWVPTGPRTWGELELETGYSARICVHGPASDSDIYRNVTYMPGIAHLARQQVIDLCSSAELQDEQFRQPSGRFRGYGSLDHSLFGDIKLASVDGHVLPTMGPEWMGFPSAREQQQARLSGSEDPLYLALVERLGQKNNQDAWHIRTAERHGMFCFLTMDFRLRRLVESLARHEPFSSLKTRVMTPVELGLHLGLRPISPQLFSYHGASWFVRPDLHWPDNKRQPLSSYRKSGRR